MARPEGTLKLTSNTEPKMNAPLDARLVASTKSDLYTMQYFYRGMIVYVKDEDAYYKLINDLPAFSASWELYGGEFSINETTEKAIDKMFE